MEEEACGYQAKALLNLAYNVAELHIPLAHNVLPVELHASDVRMRKGHCASQCFSKTNKLPTNEVTEDKPALEEDEPTLDNELSLDSAFLDAVTLESHKPTWNVIILVSKFNAKVVF